MFAVLDDIPRFLDHALNTQDMFWKNNEHFRNALDTAVACDYRDMVQAMLAYILTQITSKSGKEGRLDMRAAARGLFDALLVAIRLHCQVIANMILEVLAQHPALSRFILVRNRSLFYEFCVHYGNVEFSSRALHYRRTSNWLTPDFDSIKGDLVEPTEADIVLLMQHCSRPTMRKLLETKQLGSNYVDYNTTPITMALQAKRRDLVPFFVAAGADIDGLSRGGTQTAMSCALVSGSRTNVRLLESLGAQVKAVVIPLPSQRSKSGRYDDQRGVLGRLWAVFWGCVVWIYRVLS